MAALVYEEEELDALEVPVPRRLQGQELLQVNDKQFPGGKRHVPVLNATVGNSRLFQRRASGDSRLAPADGDVLSPRSIDSISIFSPKSPGATRSSSPGLSPGRAPSRQSTESTADTDCSQRRDFLKKPEVEPSNPADVDVGTTRSAAMLHI